MKNTIKHRIIETLALAQHEIAYATEYILGDRELEDVLDSLKDLKELAADIYNFAAENGKEKNNG